MEPREKQLRELNSAELEATTGGGGVAGYDENGMPWYHWGSEWGASYWDGAGRIISFGLA